MKHRQVVAKLKTKYFLDEGDIDVTSHNVIKRLRQILYVNKVPLLGSQILEASLGIRLSLLFGDGLQIVSANPDFNSWVNTFVKKEHLNGLKLLNFCEQLETRGYLACDLSSDNSITIKDFHDTDAITKVSEPTLSLLLSSYRSRLHQRTRLSLIVSACKKYEETLNKINVLNEKATNITPLIKVSNVGDVNSIKKKLETDGWKLGEALIGADDLEYKSPSTNAIEGFTKELQVLIKHISFMVGVPVHWFGWVDLTSNKSVADTMYDVSLNATFRERTLLSSFIYDVISIAMSNAVNSGLLKTLENDFTVSIPAFSQQKFLSIVDAMSTTFNDGVVSVDEYRRNIPLVNVTDDFDYNKQEVKDEN